MPGKTKETKEELVTQNSTQKHSNSTSQELNRPSLKIVQTAKERLSMGKYNFPTLRNAHGDQLKGPFKLRLTRVFLDNRKVKVY
jgi:hypothetical protein